MDDVDKVVNFLYSQLPAGNLTYLEFFIYMLGVILIFAAFGAAALAIRKNKTLAAEAHYRRVHCATCGWEGNVSKYVRVCPKCNDANFIARV